MAEHQQAQKSSESKSNNQTRTISPKQIPISHPAAIIQRARIDPKALTHADVMQLQRTIGNRAVGRLLSEIGLIPSKAKPVQRQGISEKEETCPACVQMPEIPEKNEPLQGKMIEPLQLQEIPEEEPLQGKFESIQRQEIPEEEEPLQTKRENNTGMSDNLKAGVENLSGIDMNDVKVHYNSSKPAGVGALAYTQGTNIHVAPGQEKHLPHEAWHVVQQAQGRVKPTMQLKGVSVNDDAGLEHEADEMGARAMQIKEGMHDAKADPSGALGHGSAAAVVQRIGAGVMQSYDKGGIHYTFTTTAGGYVDFDITRPGNGPALPVLSDVNIVDPAHPTKLNVPPKHRRTNPYQNYPLRNIRSKHFLAANWMMTGDPNALTGCPPGLTWHHHQDKGRMQLIDAEVHGAIQHNGGHSTWGKRK